MDHFQINIITEHNFLLYINNFSFLLHVPFLFIIKFSMKLNMNISSLGRWVWASNTMLVLVSRCSTMWVSMSSRAYLEWGCSLTVFLILLTSKIINGVDIMITTFLTAIDFTQSLWVNILIKTLLFFFKPNVDSTFLNKLWSLLIVLNHTFSSS